MREEPVVSPNAITFVGMDAHKKAINVAMLLPGAKQPVEWQVANEAAAIRRLAKRLVREAPGEVRCCYEAGPCGYALQRELEATGGIVCEVVAPSLIPSKPGDRIKTDRKDARKLAELQRGDLLTVVHPPTADEESVRDLCRCREDAQEDLTRARHRMGKFLLRSATICWPSSNSRSACSRWKQGFRRPPSELPIASRSAGCVLVETAWHYRHRSKSGETLRRRRQGQPARVIALADRAQERLCRRYRYLVERGKPTPKVVVAIARELVGFLWGALQVPAAVPD